MTTILTKTIASGLAVSETIVLSETVETATVFKPEIRENGVRGEIIRFKKDKYGKREKLEPLNFKQLKVDEGVKIELKTEAINKLCKRVRELQAIIEDKGVEYGFHEYKVVDDTDLVITDQNKAKIIQELLNKNLGEEVWNQIMQNDSVLASKLVNSKLHEDRLNSLHTYKEMLENDTLKEKDWQDFFEKNTWIFGYGLRYQILKMIQAQPDFGGASVDGKGGQRGDFLTATEAEKRFTCLVEIKKPNTPLLQRKQYRNGAWGISDELSGAISQIQINAAQWEISGSRTDQNKEIMKDIYTVSPKGIVIIGRTEELSGVYQRGSFERFRRELHNPEIITYDELYERAKFIVGENCI